MAKQKKTPKTAQVITIAGNIPENIGKVKLWDKLIYKVISRTPWEFIVESTKDKEKNVIVDLDLSFNDVCKKLGLEVLEFTNTSGVNFFEFKELKLACFKYSPCKYIVEKAKFLYPNKGEAFFISLDKCDRQLVGLKFFSAVQKNIEKHD
jgi:hypothetical protein